MMDELANDKRRGSQGTASSQGKPSALVGYHATNDLAGIINSGEVKPARLDSVYLFTNIDDCLEYQDEFGYKTGVRVEYQREDVLRRWKPSYAKRGSVVRLKPGRTALPV